MKNAEDIESGPEMADKDEFRVGHPSDSTPIKVSDDSNSNEILVFTSLSNVYKVQKKEIIDKFQALKKIDLEPGENQFI